MTREQQLTQKLLAVVDMYLQDRRSHRGVGRHVDFILTLTGGAVLAFAINYITQNDPVGYVLLIVSVVLYAVALHMRVKQDQVQVPSLDLPSILEGILPLDAYKVRRPKKNRRATLPQEKPALMNLGSLGGDYEFNKETKIHYLRLRGPVRRINENDIAVWIESLMDDMLLTDFPVIAIDFRHVTAIDSAGFRLLMNVRDRVQQMKGRLVFLNLDATLQRLFEVTEMSSVFEIFLSEDELNKKYGNRR